MDKDRPVIHPVPIIFKGCTYQWSLEKIIAYVSSDKNPAILTAEHTKPWNNR
jgi:hypothetical protein